MEGKVLWFDARKLNENVNDMILTVNQSSNFTGILYSCEQLHKIEHSPRMTVAAMIEEEDELLGLEDSEVVVASQNLAILKSAREKGFVTAWYIQVVDEATMNLAYEKGTENPLLIIEFKDETNIPLELIIAEMQRYDVDVFKYVKTAVDGRISGDVMEVGSKGVLLSSDSVEEIVKLNSLASLKRRSQLEVVKAKVTKVEHLGPGERACIDTTSLLTSEEAMVIGSTSSGGLLVCSETHYLPYMNTRPFRVNAGAVHSYVWCPGDKTQYITDLSVGNEVTVVDTSGNARTVTIGRMKIEVRPLLLIEAEYEGETINAIVQDDWHIRIFDGEGNPKNATTFKEGDSILAYLCEPGRHVGVKIQETILEK